MEFILTIAAMVATIVFNISPLICTVVSFLFAFNLVMWVWRIQEKEDRLEIRMTWLVLLFAVYSAYCFGVFVNAHKESQEITRLNAKIESQSKNIREAEEKYLAVISSKDKYIQQLTEKHNNLSTTHEDMKNKVMKDFDILEEENKVLKEENKALKKKGSR